MQLWVASWTLGNPILSYNQIHITVKGIEDLKYPWSGTFYFQNLPHGLMFSLKIGFCSSNKDVIKVKMWISYRICAAISPLRKVYFHFLDQKIVPSSFSTKWVGLSIDDRKMQQCNAAWLKTISLPSIVKGYIDVLTIIIVKLSLRNNYAF